jgi:ATP-dependent DNA ligase
MDRVALQSRQQRPLGRYFPEIVCVVSQLDVDVVLDGELVLWHEGRMDFAALQGRLHPVESRARELSLAVPASCAVFDVLALGGKDVCSRP